MNTSPKTLESALEAFRPITLGEMDAISLMNRTDTKYLTTGEMLLRLLADASDRGYRALETQGTMISTYDTLYYDTAGLQMFLDHHNRRLVRQKVRTRTYADSGLTFLEIKRKNNHGRTKKKRTAIRSSAFGQFQEDHPGQSRPHGAPDPGSEPLFPQPPQRPGRVAAGRRDHRTQTGRPRGQRDEGHPAPPPGQARPRE